MKTCRKSIATVLLLSIHLLTLRINDAVAERNGTSVEVNPKIILEEVIITGSGNDTRIIANAVAKDASKIGDGILTLLSEKTSPNSDLDTAQSVNIDVNEDDLERLKHVIAKYEPQRIALRKTKRKIIKDDPLQGKVAGSTTDLERTYDEVLRNISRRAPELTSSNIDATLNPYLSQTRKGNPIGIYAPEGTIRPVNLGDAQKSRSDVESSYTLPTLSDKKKLLKKYLQLNRTLTIPRDSPELEESKFNDEAADSDESIAPGRYFKIPNVKTRPNESPSVESSSNVYSESTEKSERKWNIQDTSFIPQLKNNNSYDVFNVNNLNNLNIPSDTNTVRLLSKYDRMPRPFSLVRSPDSPVIEISYRKPNPSPTSLNRQQVARSSTSVLPLILPTETLFDPSSARRYVPIKRANHFKPEGNSFNTEASPANQRTTFANYGVPTASYTNTIATTRTPLVTVNNQRRIPSLNYYAITENPVEQDVVTKTNSPKIIYVPSQTPTSHLQQEKDPQTVRRNGFLPDAAYNIPDNKQSNLNSNVGLELYNKFASLYSANVPNNNAFNVPKMVTQNYPNFGQYVSTPSYATLTPISPSLPKIRPIAKPALAPYYDTGLLVSQRAEEKKLNDKRNEENVEVNEPRAVDEDESNTEVADNKNNFENYKAPINHGSYKNHKTSNEQREKEDSEEEDKKDHYQQPKRNYDYQDKYQKSNKDDKNNDGREKYNVHKDNEEEDEEEEKDADETQEDEYVSTKKNQDERSHRYQYNKHKYDRDDNSEEEDRDKQLYDHKKRDEEKKSFRDERDDEKDKVKDKFVSGNKYFDGPRYSDYESDEKYREPYDRKKDRDEDSEDESVAEDKLVARRSKDERARRQRERYEEDRKKSDNVTQKSKPYRHRQTIPRKDSHREEQKREEYSETNPKHVREEYRHRQDVEDDEGLSHRGRDSESDKERVRDHEHGETQEHAHKHEKHHEEKKDGGNHKFEKGEGAEHKEEHHGHKGEKGHKGYKVWDEHEKAEKGHHNKEHATKEYDEKDGEEKKHEEDGGYHEEHHHDEAGKKETEFGEKGEHKKGHTTHGEHSVHKKDEYEKKTEFFDEFHDDGDVEKHGEHHHEHESKKGGHEKKGHHDVAEHEHKYGKEEKHEKGGHHHEHKGHKADEGHDHHYEHDEKHGKKEGHEGGKKWSYKKDDHGGDAGGHR